VVLSSKEQQEYSGFLLIVDDIIFDARRLHYCFRPMEQVASSDEIRVKIDAKE
jgi:hypothetical protein